MRILVVYTNTYRTFAPAPLGASLVAARLRRDGHDVRFLDLMFARDPSATAAAVARDFRPDLVAYSIRNVDSQSTPLFDPLPVIRSVVSAVRAVCPAPVLLGGTAFTTFPAQFLQALDADYGLAGDDLDNVSRFVDSLEAGSPDRALPGLVFRDSGAVTQNPFAIRGYSGVPFDNWGLLDLHAYRRSLSTLFDCGLVVRTGCPFRCSFCDYHTTFGRTYHLRDPEMVAEEALALQRLGARSVIFADAGFNRPLDHAKAVLDAMLRAGVRLRLTAIYEPGEADQEFMRLFRRAGGMGAVVYANSLSDAVLARNRKPFLAADVVRETGMLRAAGIEVFLFLTLGAPGETPETVEETLSLAPRLRARRTLAGYGYRVQPDTELREVAVAEGLLAADDDCFKAHLYCAPETPPEMLAARVKAFAAETRWETARALPFMARLLWEKFRP